MTLSPNDIETKGILFEMKPVSNIQSVETMSSFCINIVNTLSGQGFAVLALFSQFEILFHLPVAHCGHIFMELITAF